MSIVAGNGRWHADFDAMRAANLFALHRYRHRATEDNQVIKHPRHTHEDRQNFVFRAVEVAPDPNNHAHNIQQHQEDIGPGDHPVDILLFHQPALRGDVEFPFMRVNQRHHGWRRDVPGQHRFVNFTPEGVAIFPLNLRVRQAGVDHVRQNEQGNHQRRRIDDVSVKEQERQRRSEEDKPWNTGQEVEHGVDVAQPLRQLQPFTHQRVIEPENLHHAAGPANTLADVPTGIPWPAPPPEEYACRRRYSQDGADAARCAHLP